jgi:hypothetical protein
MNKDRIQINGEWYVKESTSKKQNQIVIDDDGMTSFRGYVYETDKYSWEATKVYHIDDIEFFPDFGIKFIHKEIKPQKEEYWDNNSWFAGVLDGNETDLHVAHESMDEEGVAHFKAFLAKLREKGWL